MADISAIPAIQDVLLSGDNVKEYIAGADITQGMTVAFHGTGVDRTVHPCVTGTTTQIVGVAIKSAASGAKVKVAGRGCIAKVINFDDTTGIDAGDPIQDNVLALGGCIGPATLVDAGVVAVVKYIAGYAIEDIDGGGYGAIDICPSVITSANNA